MASLVPQATGGRTGRISRTDPARGNAAAVLDLAIWLMISTYLYVDTISGALMDAGGGAPLSQAWKGLMLLLIGISSIRRSVTTVAILTGSLLLLLSGPFARMITSPISSEFAWEVATGLKALLPLAVLSWCNDQRSAAPQLLQVWSRRALWANASAVALNIAVGALGFGFSSYNSPAGGIGMTGFFYAGNEVGAVFAVLSGFVLMETWNRRRRAYWIVAALLVAIAFLITTKSAILAAVLLSPLVPLAYLRGRWSHMPATYFVSLCVIAAALVVAAIRIWEVLEVAGLAARLELVYAQRGWTGVLFSGRDQFLAAASGAVFARFSWSEVFFGLGSGELMRLGIKESVEMDPFDLYLWFGMPGLLYLAAFLCAFLYVPLRGYAQPENSAAPPVLLTTLVLLGICVIAGHVILGTLAGPAWAVLTALVLVDQANFKRSDQSRN